jgi:hypothetical protein
MSGFPWTPGKDPSAEHVVKQMRGVIFDAEGMRRTYWDFYVGFGLMIGAFLATQGATLWLLASCARRDARSATPLVVTVGLSVVLNAALAHRYFFTVPAVFSMLIGGCLAMTVIGRKHSSLRAQAES